VRAPCVLFPTSLGVYRRGMRARASATRAVATALGFVLVLLSLFAPTASAQATCSFDEGTGVLQVTLLGSAPAVLVRQAEAIALDATPCGTATITNTESILVAGTGQGQPDDLTIDLAGGPFAPGLQTEADGGEPEIEISADLPGGGDLRIAGAEDNDVLTLGAAGANLNADEAVGDVDLTLTGPADWEIAGRGGADAISLAGGGGAGEAIAAASVLGGVGDDTVFGMVGGSTIDGGEGNDTMDYAAAAQVRADLSKGIGRPGEGLEDSLVAIEGVVGTSGSDRLIGDSADNTLAGGDGDDWLDGGKGSDLINGGQGADTADYSGAPKGVSVDLEEGTATGIGADTLSGVENIKGSRHDDVLLGSPDPNAFHGGGGDDEISGNAGRDAVIGALGNDLLFGGADRDTVSGGRGKDQLDGGEGRDTCIPGPDPDAWTGCETIKL